MPRDANRVLAHGFDLAESARPEMHRIRVAGIAPSPEYDSPHAAIGGAKQSNATWLKKTGVDAVFGQQIERRSRGPSKALRYASFPVLRSASGAIRAASAARLSALMHPARASLVRRAAPRRSESFVRHNPRELGPSSTDARPGWKTAHDAVHERRRAIPVSVGPLNFTVFSTLQNLESGELLLYWHESE